MTRAVTLTGKNNLRKNPSFSSRSTATRAVNLCNVMRRNCWLVLCCLRNPNWARLRSR